MIEDITTISKVALDEGDVLIITVDTGNMPSGVAQRHMNNILEAAKVYFFSNKIFVVPKGVEFSVMTPYKGEKVES